MSDEVREMAAGTGGRMSPGVRRGSPGWLDDPVLRGAMFAEEVPVAEPDPAGESEALRPSPWVTREEHAKLAETMAETLRSIGDQVGMVVRLEHFEALAEEVKERATRGELLGWAEGFDRKLADVGTMAAEKLESLADMVGRMVGQDEEIRGELAKRVESVLLQLTERPTRGEMAASVNALSAALNRLDRVVRDEDRRVDGLHDRIVWMAKVDAERCGSLDALAERVRVLEAGIRDSDRWAVMVGRLHTLEAVAQEWKAGNEEVKADIELLKAMLERRERDAVEGYVERVKVLERVVLDQGKSTAERFEQMSARMTLIEATLADEPDDEPDDGVDGLLHYAWTIIANAGEGHWERESAEWQAAARRFRAMYHDHLGLAKTTAPTLDGPMSDPADRLIAAAEGLLSAAARLAIQHTIVYVEDGRELHGPDCAGCAWDRAVDLWEKTRG